MVGEQLVSIYGPGSSPLVPGQRDSMGLKAVGIHFENIYKST